MNYLKWAFFWHFFSLLCCRIQTPVMWVSRLENQSVTGDFLFHVSAQDMSNFLILDFWNATEPIQGEGVTHGATSAYVWHPPTCIVTACGWMNPFRVLFICDFGQISKWPAAKKTVKLQFNTLCIHLTQIIFLSVALKPSFLPLVGCSPIVLFLLPGCSDYKRDVA